MKKLLLIITIITTGLGLFAQECSGLFISEYVEGSGNNKALEIYNPTNETIDLSTYVIRRYSNGSPVFTDETSLSGTIQPKGVVVVTNGQTDSLWVSNGGYWSVPIDMELYEKGELHGSGEYPTPFYFNGNDAITLETITGDIKDIFGKVGTDPGSNGWNDIPPTYFAGEQFWTSWSKDQTLVRKHTVTNGVTENPTVFMVNVEWDSLAKDFWDSLGYHYCDCGTLDINTNGFRHSVILYPNPSIGGIIKISASERIGYISIVNELGQVVYTNEYSNPTVSISIDGNLLPKGNYVVTARFVDNSFFIDKLIIR